MRILARHLDPDAAPGLPPTRAEAGERDSARQAIARSTHRFTGMRITAAERSIQREADDAAPEAKPPEVAPERDEPKPLDAPVPAAKTTDAQGSTLVQDPPTLNYQTYSGATLADVAGSLPEEAGAVEFDFTVQTQGDPISNAQVEVKQLLTLPRWAERDKQCKSVQQAW